MHFRLLRNLSFGPLHWRFRGRHATEPKPKELGSSRPIPLAAEAGVGPKANALPSVFIIEAAFLRELIGILTVDANEQMRFLTGPKLGSFRIVSRLAKPAVLREQSPVFVRATGVSAAHVLIQIIEEGAELHVIAHSHPGCGAGATTPSGTDLACLGKLQRNGSPAIGCIVTRDSHVRFFSVTNDFHVSVLGTGAKEVSKHVFHITSPH
jgi:proteasome lid subunit RPN8/RPN11